MSNLTVNRQGAEVMRDNETGYGDSFVVHARDYRPSQPKQIEYRVYAIWGVVCIGFLLLFYVVYSLWKFAYCFSGMRVATCQTLDSIEPIAFGIVLFTPIVLWVVVVLVKLWTRMRYDNALANKANLVLNRFGDNEPADLWDRINNVQLLAMLADRYTQATQMETTIAKHKVYRGVNSLSLGRSGASKEPLLLEAEQDTPLAPIPATEWLNYLADRPHILFGAATGEGKTTTAKAVINQRIERGDSIFIIDPHSDDWFSLPVRGGAENWVDVADAINCVYEEYTARQRMRNEYLTQFGTSMPVDLHKGLTVLVDEAFLVAYHLDTGNKKGVINYWQMLTEVLGSGARKVNISVVLLSQTTNVEDLGLSGPMRRNFTRVALDAAAIKLMIVQEEKEPKHREALYQALIGMQYPATTVIESRVELLDRTGLLQLAERQTNARAALWVPSSVPTKERLASPNGTSAGDGTGDAQLLQELIALRRQGLTRDEARSQHGLTFRNDLWTIACEIVARDTA